jgi:hypothetical protein
MSRLDRAVWLSFRAVWSRLRPRSSQYTAFTKPSFQTSRGRHAARETISIEAIPIYHVFQRDVALNRGVEKP